MKIAKTESFENNYTKLPAQNISYPSLRVKKIKGIDRFEARVDRSYRFTFEKTKDILILRTVGPHDEGLGKK